jgi:hypothetical protein
VAITRSARRPSCSLRTRRELLRHRRDSTSAVGVPIKRQCQYSVIFSAACDRIRPVPGLNPACPVP